MPRCARPRPRRAAEGQRPRAQTVVLGGRRGPTGLEEAARRVHQPRSALVSCSQGWICPAHLCGRGAAWCSARGAPVRAAHPLCWHQPGHVGAVIQENLLSDASHQLLGWDGAGDVLGAPSAAAAAAPRSRSRALGTRGHEWVRVVGEVTSHPPCPGEGAPPGSPCCCKASCLWPPPSPPAPTAADQGLVLPAPAQLPPRRRAEAATAASHPPWLRRGCCWVSRGRLAPGAGTTPPSPCPSARRGTGASPCSPR